MALSFEFAVLFVTCHAMSNQIKSKLRSSAENLLIRNAINNPVYGLAMCPKSSKLFPKDIHHLNLHCSLSSKLNNASHHQILCSSLRVCNAS